MHGDDTIETIAQRPVVLVDSQSTLRKAAELLTQESIGVAIVRAWHPPALVSERDIVAALADGANPDRDRIDSIMTQDVDCASPLDSIRSVAEKMLADEIRHVPIVQDGAVVRVVSEREVLRALLSDVSSGTKG